MSKLAHLHVSADAAFTQFTVEIFSLAAEINDRRGSHEIAAKRKLYTENTLTKVPQHRGRLIEFSLPTKKSA